MQGAKRSKFVGCPFLLLVKFSAKLRISDECCQILKEVLPLSALAIQLNYPKTKGKFCRDSQNERKALPSFFSVSHLLFVSRFRNT
jgi:hypothetical protein